MVGDAASNAIITKSTSTVDVTNTQPTTNTQPITNAQPFSLLDNSNIYDDLESDSPITLLVSIQPSESALQVLVRVPRLQAKPQSWSPVFNHFISTLLDDYYILKRTKKRTQDR